ncbi:CLUMA_CG000331, isoform A [Clunio marinus]|uniref:CLUMA_CG000331, isoform A n=1 Tax=Clunio marinus TaxID=568069 RepID=A0A1J1HEK9_9DIPT|nr:CLUMA_CG000331, isoform A [Clunio marinus]
MMPWTSPQVLRSHAINSKFKILRSFRCFKILKTKTLLNSGRKFGMRVGEEQHRKNHVKLT